MLLNSQDLGEDVNNLILCADINKINLTYQDLLLNEVIMNLNVFRPCMKHWVLSQLNTAKVITIYDNLSLHMHPKSPSSLRNQATSHAAIAAPLYSASVLDKATVDCFLLLQVTATFPKENIKPLVDLLFEMLPAQSASMYSCTCNSVLASLKRP
jgi:hypothetical protein